MLLNSHLRRFFLNGHIVFSVGWLGSVAAFLALAIAGLVRSGNPDVIRAVYPSMELIGWYVLVPLSVAALLTGLAQALGTEWGLFRHYWVAVKFVLTVGATAVLLVHMRAINRAAALAATGMLGSEFSRLQVRLIVDAGLAAIVLLAATTLSVYKPGGLTPYGWRTQEERTSRAGRAWPSQVRSRPLTAWPYAVAVGGVLIVVVILHLTGIVGHRH